MSEWWKLFACWWKSQVFLFNYLDRTKLYSTQLQSVFSIKGRMVWRMWSWVHTRQHRTMWWVMNNTHQLAIQSHACTTDSSAILIIVIIDCELWPHTSMCMHLHDPATWQTRKINDNIHDFVSSLPNPNRSYIRTRWNYSYLALGSHCHQCCSPAAVLCHYCHCHSGCSKEEAQKFISLTVLKITL